VRVYVRVWGVCVRERERVCVCAFVCVCMCAFGGGCMHVSHSMSHVCVRERVCV